MRLFPFLVMLGSLLVAQSILPSRIGIGSVAPDFVILVVLFFGLFRGPISASIFGFVIGFIQDLTNPGLLGLNALTKAVLGYFIGNASGKLVPENALFMFVVFAVAAFAHDIVYLTFFHWPDVGSALLQILVVGLPSALYTAAVGVLLHVLVQRFAQHGIEISGQEGE